MSGIMHEELLYWQLNGLTQHALLYDGHDEEALLRGHLITAGLAMPEDDITVALKDGLWQVLKPENTETIALEELKPLDSAFCIRMDDLDLLCNQVMALDNSAGLHAVLLSDGEKTVVGRDVGRHNALDKAVGKAIQSGLKLENSALCGSGRLSLEMLSKAAFAGIPVLATRKQVGSLCVQYAERLNIAVCCVGREPVCYSSDWRIL